MCKAVFASFVWAQAKDALSDLPTEIYEVFSVAAQSGFEYRIGLYEGEYLMIQIVGNGASELRLEIYDADGNLISEARNNCGWDEHWVDFYVENDGVFTIKIVNPDEFENDFDLKIKWASF